MAVMRPVHRVLVFVLGLVLVAAWSLAAAAQEQAPAAAAPIVSATLQEVRAVTLQDGKAGVDVTLEVRLDGWTEAAFPALSGKLAAFTPAGERVLDPVEVAVVEQRSPSEAVVRLRFERVQEAPYMTAFVGLPASQEAGRAEVWTGVVFSQADIQS